MNVNPTPATQAPFADIPAFVTRKQLAGLLAVSEQHVDNLMRRWAVPRFQLGRRVVFAGADVVTAIKNSGGAA